jgi:hypothetical protein
MRSLPPRTVRLVAVFIVAVLPLTPVSAFAAGPPHLDSAISCQAAGAIFGKRACLRDENAARRTLARNWNRYAPENRKLCVDTNETGGPPSYVELLACLNDLRDARRLKNDPLFHSPEPVPSTSGLVLRP